jgi:aspartyl-tRNA(Asn)/glutamyl-tRNA(Gln) amidotransferase subunit A
LRATGAVHYLGLGEVGRAIATRELSSEEVTSGLLDRISALNPGLGAYYTVFAESALDEARRADAEIAGGRHRGPLHGVPIAFKDLYQLGPTSAGSAVLKDNVAGREAALVTRMREAGAVVLGKLATHEFALAAATEADHFPPARNPWNRALSPGGSSTGAGTALAAGLAFGAWGTDTGGSVRIPAAHCGVAGYKPTFGLLDLAGVIPLAWSLDHAGPMARSVVDAALMFNSAGAPLEVTAGGGVEGLRLGVPRGFWADTCDPQVAAAVETAIERFAALGATPIEVDLGLAPADVIATGYLVTMSEAAAHHRVNLRRHGPEFGREFRLVLKSAALIPASAYVDAQRARRTVAAAVERALGGCDVLVMPTVGSLADPIPAGPRPLPLRINARPAPVYTWLANLFGGPAVSVPCGLSREGLPIGIQVLGRQLDDGRVVSAAAAYQAATDWPGRRPLP